MAFDQNKFSSRFRVPAERVIETLETGLPGVDAARARGLGQLSLVRDAKARALSREQVLLAKKSGAGHPRIAVAAQRQAVNEQFRREIAIAREYAETPTPAPSTDTFVLHGFVRRRRDGAGVPGLTVAITDGKGTWVKQLGYACTDARGYFILEVKAGRLATGVATDQPIGVAGIPGLNTGATTGGNQVPLFPSVFDQKSRLLYTDARSIVFAAGGVDLRLITLDDTGDCGCTPPSGSDGVPPSASNPTPASPTATTPSNPAPGSTVTPNTGVTSGTSANPSNPSTNPSVSTLPSVGTGPGPVLTIPPRNPTSPPLSHVGGLHPVVQPAPVTDSPRSGSAAPVAAPGKASGPRAIKKASRRKA